MKLVKLTVNNLKYIRLSIDTFSPLSASSLVPMPNNLKLSLLKIYSLLKKILRRFERVNLFQGTVLKT